MLAPRRLSSDRERKLAITIAGAGITALAIAPGMIEPLRGLAVWCGMRLDIVAMASASCLAVALGHRMIDQRNLVRELARRGGNERDARALALRDPLTGLLNRRAMADIGERHRARGGVRAVLLCDLDNFKQINDTDGHRVGDGVLREFAQRLARLSRDDVLLDAVRLGGDEFLLFAAGPAVDTASLAQDVLGVAAEPYCIDGIDLRCSTSVGIVQAEADETMEELLGMADDAMYEAKRSGAPGGISQRDAPGTSGQGGRRVFEQQIDADHRGSNLFVAAIGIDRVREMRRALGYGLGSQLLRELTRRLEAESDALVFERLSSDVLGVAFFAADSKAARAILEQMRSAAEGPVAIGDAAVEIRLIIGVAGPGAVADVRDLAEQSQAALDDAWRNGARLRSFEPGDHASASENVVMMADLRDAIAHDRLEVHYQPKLRLATGEIDSFEALVRWPHLTLGTIPPSRFVPIAEKTGDIRELTEWVFNRVLADRAFFAIRGIAKTIYVNVSANLISDQAFAGDLIARLEPLDGAIGIEITETAVLANPTRALPNLNRLAEAKVKIAIDDYGVGLSSLAYLKQLPASELKLDMMFVTNLATSHRDPMIVRSTIELAHGLGMEVTAEGVDSIEAYALLKVMGCDMLQGYAISKALPADALIAFVESHDASPAHGPDVFAAMQFAKAA